MKSSSSQLALFLIFAAAFLISLASLPETYAQTPAKSSGQPSTQTPVDNLVRTLDSLTLVSFDNWRASADLKGLKAIGDTPTQPGFDDSKWDILKIGESIYPDSCWLRKEITLPKQYLGKEISGPVKFLVSVDDYGYLWVNGESKGYFPWDGEFELTKNALPGQKFVLVIKAINTGGPLRLLRARLELETASPLTKKLSDFSLSLRTAQKLLSFDTYQTNARKKIDPKVDKSRVDRGEKGKLQDLLQHLAGSVDVDALGSGAMDKFALSLDKIRAELKPIRDYAKRFTLYFDANAHIDAAWLWRDKETQEVCKNTFSSVLHMMDVRPEFTYTQSAAAYYDWMKRLDPEVFKGIQQRVKEGRWEVVGGMWVEPDCNLPSGESWFHHLLYSKKWFRQNVGSDVKIGWNPDSFGYNLDMPMFYNNAGMQFFVTQKIGWNETNVFPYRLFWWQSPDSSRVLTYFPFDYVNEVDDPFRLVDWLRQFEANTGFSKMMVLFGVGDHGGGPSLEMIDRIHHLDSLDIYPSIEYGTTGTYFDWLQHQDLSTVPVWNDELYLEYHQGTYTTQAKMKEHNRRDEVLLTNAEKFSSIASLYGRPYNGENIEDAWHNVLFNQFHDILPGSGIRENYIDATEKYALSEKLGNHELDGSLKEIASRVSTAAVTRHSPTGSHVAKGSATDEAAATNSAAMSSPVLVFNPLAWDRSDMVTVPLPEGDKAEYTVFDAKGKEVPAQSLERDRLSRDLLFFAHDVPSLGYSTFSLRKGKPSLHGHTSVTNSVLENGRFRVTLDPDSGWIKSLYDKHAKTELLAGYGNEIQILEDKPSAWDAWNIGLTGVKYPSKLRSIQLVENGPVRTVIRVTRDYLKPGVKKDFPTEDFPSTFFTQDIILYDGIDRVDFKTDVDWWEDKTMLKVAFPLTLRDTVATYDIPYGTITRSTQSRNSWEEAKVEVPSQRWADLTQGNFGVSILNRSKYGYDVKGNVIRLSLLRSPKWPDPTADRGKHSIEYALLPHDGPVLESDVVRRGYEYNNPLIGVMTTAHKGTLPAAFSFVRLEPAGLVLTEVKIAEESNAWIIQWYDAGGKGADALLTLPKTPGSVNLSSILEGDGAPVQFSKNVVKVRTKPHSVVTLKVKFK